MSQDKCCANCYWWDAAEGWMGDGFHQCHNQDAAKDNSYPTLHTVPEEACKHFRVRTADDPSTVWNRVQPGRNTEKPRNRVKDPAAVKRGRRSKRKGKSGEKEWGEYVVERIGGEFIARGGDRDVQFIGNALERWHSEVKRRKAFAMLTHTKQAEGDCLTHHLDKWVVPFRADCEPGERKRWHVILDADDWLADTKELQQRRLGQLRPWSAYNDGRDLD
uniref:Uncharacterized protein n=1 Tax=viral metagenome TaxID=1070528 RepID=A0A6M3L8P1_9ZZZZ